MYGWTTTREEETTDRTSHTDDRTNDRKIARFHSCYAYMFCCLVRCYDTVLLPISYVCMDVCRSPYIRYHMMYRRRFCSGSQSVHCSLFLFLVARVMMAVWLVGWLFIRRPNDGKSRVIHPLKYQGFGRRLSLSRIVYGVRGQALLSHRQRLFPSTLMTFRTSSIIESLLEPVIGLLFEV